MEADRFGAALIGSAHSLGYLEAIRESDNYNFVGVAERHPDRLESAQANPRWDGVRWASVNDILSDDSIEVVCVETDPLESLAFSLDCIRAGKHAKVAKPPGEIEVSRAQKALPDQRKARGQGAGKFLPVAGNTVSSESC